MNDWSALKRKEKKAEICIILLGMIGLVIGGILDILVKHGIVFHVVENLDSFSLTLIQLQGSIVTLTIAIIALLAGNISDSYLGISITEFFLDIKPVFLKQKTIIIIEFLLLGVSIISHLMQLYNLVMYSFAFSILIILNSITKIYAVFQGVRFVHTEIESYTGFLFDSDKEISEIAVTVFADAWKGEISDQSNIEYKLHTELLRKFSQNMINNFKDISQINEICVSIASAMLQSNNEDIRIRGIDFVEDCYDTLWRWILKNKEATKEIKGSFRLFSRIQREWYQAVVNLPAEVVEEHLKWQTFSDHVVRVTCYINHKNEKIHGDVSALLQVSRLFGHYIETQKQKRNIIDRSYWGHIFSDTFSFGIFNVPPETENFYEETCVLIDFNICIGYIFSGELELIKKGIFLDGTNALYGKNAHYKLYRILLIHLFLYYVGFIESKECINSDIQNQVKDLLKNAKVVKMMNQFLMLLESTSYFLTMELEKNLEKTLHEYELFPNHSGFKLSLTPNVTRDYYLFINLFVGKFFWKRDCIKKGLSPEIYSSYLLTENYSYIKDCFIHLSELFFTDDFKKREGYVEEMMNAFLTTFRPEYKHAIIRKAKEEQELYDANSIQEKVQKEISTKIREKLYSLFGSMIINDSQSLFFENIPIYRFTGGTKDVDVKTLSDSLEYAVSFFVEWLIVQLIEKYNVEEYVRPKQDDVFREYIERKSYDILLGPDYTFSCFDYLLLNNHKEFLDKYDCRFTGGTGRGIALQSESICICIENIMTNIYSPELETIGLVPDEKTGMYVYEPETGLQIEFSEDELREYIHNGRKTIEVYMSVSISVNDKKEVLVVNASRF